MVFLVEWYLPVFILIGGETHGYLFFIVLFFGQCRYFVQREIASGDPTPSGQDIDITREMDRAGELIGIELSDHIILGNNCYVSLAERGIL